MTDKDFIIKYINWNLEDMYTITLWYKLLQQSSYLKGYS